MNIDRENCQASKVARYLKSIIRKFKINSLYLLVKTGIFASNMVGYTGWVSCSHVTIFCVISVLELHLVVVMILTAVHSDVSWSLASVSAAAVRLCSDQQPRSGLS